MPMCDIKDHKTGETLKAYDFGGPEIYYAGTSLVYAPLGGTSVSTSENIATLNPLDITSIMKPRWEVTWHTDIGTANWRVSVVDTSTGNTKDGVYPFNLQGNVYELECQPGTWVMASCGGYKIESSWNGQTTEQVYRLKGTGEIMIVLKGTFYLDAGFEIKPWYYTEIAYNVIGIMRTTRLTDLTTIFEYKTFNAPYPLGAYWKARIVSPTIYEANLVATYDIHAIYALYKLTFPLWADMPIN